MRKSIIETAEPSSSRYEVIEEMVRQKAQEYIQTILEEEVETFLGRKKFERIKPVDGAQGYRNGYGKSKQFTIMTGGPERDLEAGSSLSLSVSCKRWVHCCLSYTCRVWPEEILRWLCGACWEKERRCQHPP